jgi:hypothetical protein
MKVYYVAYDGQGHALFREFLEGSYSIQRPLLWVDDAPPDTTHVWEQLEYHDQDDQSVYEINLPHTEAELAPYRLPNEDPAKGPTGWKLPWYVVAHDPVKVMEYRLSNRIMGVPERMDQQVMEQMGKREQARGPCQPGHHDEGLRPCVG